MVDEVIDPFDDPGSGRKVEWEELRGKLLLIYPRKLEENVPTQDYGEKEAIRGDLTVLDGPTGPDELRDILVFPLALQGQLRANVGTGRPCLGRLGGGSKDPRATREEKAWRMMPANDVDKQRARDYINKKPKDKDKFDDVPF